MLTKDQIIYSNSGYIDLLDYMDKIGYYQIGRIKGFDYWTRRMDNAIVWTSPMPNENYSDQIENDSMPITFYCYAWQWTSSEVYQSENAHRDDPNF